MNQAAQILEHLRSGGTLTVAEALARFGCYALSQRAGELRQRGHPVRSRMIRTASGKHIAEYYYDAPQQEKAA